MTAPFYLRVAIDAPLLRLFDYLPPIDYPAAALTPGLRLTVSFAGRTTVGILIEISQQTDVAANKLRRVKAVLDEQPCFSDELLKLCRWASDYYIHPLGEVMHTALPASLRIAKSMQPVQPELPQSWRLTSAGMSATVKDLSRAPAQAQLLAIFQEQDNHCLSREHLQQSRKNWRPALLALEKKSLLERFTSESEPASTKTSTPLTLNADQQQALDVVRTSLGQFQQFLLHGVTGSGKTEVYLQLVSACLKVGKQALILVPEIGLTPQLLERFRQRFKQPLGVLHSRLTDKERLLTWQQAQRGELSIILGTRSAVFAPLNNLGLIIVDEEHDASFKQQDNFRYHARDLAIMRAKRNQIPILLGSATPSLESLHNVAQGLYQQLDLPERAGTAVPPKLGLLDQRRRPLAGGISEPLLQISREHLQAGKQVLLFLNRRGYAPVILCHNCAWTAQCTRCDSKLTYHHGKKRLLCHHCGHSRRLPESCPECQQTELLQVGIGTERLEEELRGHFPDTHIIRVDRDSTKNKGDFELHLTEIHKGKPCILIGTQMLAKGHHFENVTLVGIIDADGGLYSSDFRASENLAQQILQVAGRAGRGDSPGQVLIQTHNPEHPLLLHLIDSGYSGFAQAALAERKATCFPPYTRLALLRAESVNQNVAMQFLHQLRGQVDIPASVQVLGPAPALIERVAGRYRAQLLLQGTNRAQLNQTCRQLRLFLEFDKAARKVRWSLDVDPTDLY